MGRIVYVAWKELVSKVVVYRAAAFDAVVIMLSFPISYLIRVGDNILYYPFHILFIFSSVFGLIGIPVFFFYEVHRSVWKHISTHDCMRILKASTFSVLIFMPFLFFSSPAISIPRSVPIIHWLVLIALTGGSKLLYRLYYESFHKKNMNANEKIPAVLLYDEDETDFFLRYHQKSGIYDIVGIADPGTKYIGQEIHGVRVLGTLDDLSSIIESCNRKPKILILPSSPLRGWAIKHIANNAELCGLSIVKLPPFDLVKKDTNQIVVAKKITVEDLIGRQQLSLNTEDVKDLIKNKCVLITGAGGSIGGEITRQIMSLSPSNVVLLDNSEYLLYLIDSEVSSNNSKTKIKCLLCDIRDKFYVQSIIDQYRPSIVFHAAALKHVPMVEENPEEGILTNVIGTKNVAEACKKFGVSAMVQISTDKVVKPINVMGATKRLAEMYCQTLDLESENTKFITVRFGNVLGSNGSVVPLFEKQIRDGGPVTVTHPDMTRYFMSISEAVELVLVAAVIGNRRSSSKGQIFVLDMGEPVKILELAKQMIRLEKSDVQIVFTGIRPGEKMHEELYDDNEELVPSGYKGVRLISSNPRVLHDIRELINQFEDLAKKRNTKGVIALLNSCVPYCSLSDETVSWDKPTVH